MRRFLEAIQHGPATAIMSTTDARGRVHLTWVLEANIAVAEALGWTVVARDADLLKDWPTPVRRRRDPGVSSS